MKTLSPLAWAYFGQVAFPLIPLRECEVVSAKDALRDGTSSVVAALRELLAKENMSISHCGLSGSFALGDTGVSSDIDLLVFDYASAKRARLVIDGRRIDGHAISVAYVDVRCGVAPDEQPAGDRGVVSVRLGNDVQAIDRFADYRLVSDGARCVLRAVFPPGIDARRYSRLTVCGTIVNDAVWLADPECDWMRAADPIQ